MRKNNSLSRNHFELGSAVLGSNFLRMRRSSMKLNAVIAHSTDPNEIITIVSIGRGPPPAYHCIRRLRRQIPRRCGRAGRTVWAESQSDEPPVLVAIVGLKSIPAMQYSAERP